MREGPILLIAKAGVFLIYQNKLVWSFTCKCASCTVQFSGWYSV